MKRILFFLFFNLALVDWVNALSVTFNPPVATCGSQTVTATFNCSFNGLIFFSWPSGVDISEVGVALMVLSQS